MRGKVASLSGAPLARRITPAHAGKSISESRSVKFRQDHPRTCGEKVRATAGTRKFTGSPPHMRGKASFTTPVGVMARITPAHAGKSLTRFLHLKEFPDHPRTCGEKLFIPCLLPKYEGSPPHMRGKEKYDLIDFISAGSPPHMRGKAF